LPITILRTWVARRRSQDDAGLQFLQTIEVWSSDAIGLETEVVEIFFALRQHCRMVGATESPSPVISV